MKEKVQEAASMVSLHPMNRRKEEVGRHSGKGGTHVKGFSKNCPVNPTVMVVVSDGDLRHALFSLGNLAMASAVDVRSAI